MAITINSLARKIGQTRKNYPELAIKPSKPLRAKSPEIAEFPLSASEHNSESQQEISKAVKPKNMHIPCVKFKKQTIPRRNSSTESQSCIFEGDAVIGKRANSKNMQKNAVHIGVKRPAKRASNKTEIEHENSPTVTSKAKPNPSNKEASNDDDYENQALANVNTLPEQGVLLNNENANLPIAQEVKAVVKVDKLAITLDIPSHQYEEVLEAARDMCKAGKDGVHLTKAHVKHGDRYRRNYSVCDGKKKLGLISLEPLQNKSIRFMRVEFTPSKIGKEGCQRLAQTIRSLIGMNASEIINDANITQLHIAVDLYDIDINSLLYFSAHTTDTCTWGKIYKRGKQVMYRLESQYIGALKSNLRIVAYDKRAEIIKVSKGKIVPKKSIVRNEFRLKPRQIKTKGSSSNCKCSVQFDNLESLGNPMQNLRITGVPTPDKDDGHFTLLVHAAQHIGAQTALAMLKNSRKRAEYRKHLLGQAANYWKAEEYWERAIIAVRKTLASIS